MSHRVSRSLLDPWVGPPIKKLYRFLPIPRWYPPEGIIALGHLSAIAGACGFAWATTTAWGGVLAAVGVAGNHVADCLDGTHARSTGQCRNGGELLDHFTDPLSFAYLLVGLSVGCGRLDLGLAAVIILFSIAVLTNIKAKMIGRFTLATFGPTEFKALLVLFGIVLSVIIAFDGGGGPPLAARLTAGFLWLLVGVGVLQLVRNLVQSVREVNREGQPPDTTEWDTVRAREPGK